MAGPLCALALMGGLGLGLAVPAASAAPAAAPLTLMKRTAAASSADYPDYQVGVKYDEYPVVVPKRAAVLLDRIMVALQKAVDDPHRLSGGPGLRPDATERRLVEPAMMDLERRNRKEGGRVYWRCYFNAVTCF